MIKIVSCLLCICCLAAEGALITQHTNGAVGTSGFVGQSFSTPNDGTADQQIAVNWIATNGLAVAEGNLFLLDQEYLGTPAGLSAGTAGYVSDAAALGASYTFPVAVTLQPNTMYWIYVDETYTGATPVRMDLSGGYGSGERYSTPVGSYLNSIGIDLGFQVTGSAVPEPGVWSYLFCGAVVCGCLTLRRRFQSSITS